MKIFDKFIEKLKSIVIVTDSYEKCYKDMEYRGVASMGCCCGVCGGTKATEYLSEHCIDCPHWVCINK